MKRPKKQKSPTNIPTLLGKPVLPYEIFHEKTKNKKHSPQLDPENWPDEWKNIYFKSYSRFPEIMLPTPTKLQKKTLSRVLIERTADRSSSDLPIRLSKLSTLLYYSVGLKDPQSGTSRFYPSAGARYPIETYVLSKNTQLKKSIYHYYVRNHSLEELFSTSHLDLNDYFIQPWVSKAACVLLFTGVFKRTTIKYGDRGYRYLLTEAGHIGENVSLVATALNLVSCPNESFIDDKINTLLDLDGTNESIIYTMTLSER